MKYAAVFVAFVLLPFTAIGIGQTMAPLSVRTLLTSFADAGSASTVGVQSHITQQTDSIGGPQALEGYTLVAHDRGTVALALGTIGNVEQNGAGDVNRIASLQGGGVVTGPGRVHQWSALSLFQPRARRSAPAYTGPVNIDRFDYITFDNGWSIRPNGDQLQLCDPRGICRAF